MRPVFVGLGLSAGEPVPLDCELCKCSHIFLPCCMGQDG